MITSATKRYMLPFSLKTGRASEAEEAAIFSLAEMQRKKGGGLLARQQQEKLVFIAKFCYPLWLFPKNNRALMFDGLNCSTHSIAYLESPSASVFFESLKANQRTRENYLAFLIEHNNYFHQPPEEKRFTFQGLIADPLFQKEFSIYRKEAVELTIPTALLLPLLDESTISTTLIALDKLQVYLKDDAEKLLECLRFLTKTTSQYITEIQYEAAAAKEEADAKIKAQEEFINPQIAKLTKMHQHKIKCANDGFDKELKMLENLKFKTQRFIENGEAKVRRCELEAKAQGKKGHKNFERRWKEKVRLKEKELSGLRKELKNIENNAKNLSKQKKYDISKLTFALDCEIKLARQPLLELEEAREVNMITFKQETDRLFTKEKAIVDGLKKSLRLRETINSGFEALGFIEYQLKNPTLFYVPFYTVCYETGLARRILCVSPSTVNATDFLAKLKGMLGLSKGKNLLRPRFLKINSLIENVEVLTRQNSFFENQILSLGDRNNLLNNSDFCVGVESGLVYLQHQGWLSEREIDDLSRRIVV